MKLIKLALIVIGVQVASFVLVPILLFATQDGPSMDGLMMLGPLLVGLALIPVVIVVSALALLQPEIKKDLKSQIIIGTAFLLNSGFALYQYVT